MEEEKSFTRRIYEQAEQYAKTTIELYKLKAIDKFASVGAAISIGYILWVVTSMFLLFVNVGLAFYLGEVLGKWHYGFFIMAGIYALIGLIIFVLRNKCLKGINNLIIKLIFKD